MQKDFHTLKKASYVSVAAMAVLLVGAFVYYKERILFLDASYVLFRIVTEHRFVIQENRFGSFITQAVPLLGGKWHLSMKTIMMAYSASFNVFYLAVIGILAFRLRQYALAILMSFYYLLYASDAFYWTNNEVHQGIAWMFLMFGFALHGSKQGWNTILQVLVFMVLGFLAVSSHVLVVMPVLFLWCYILSDKNLCTFSVRDAIIFSILVVGFVAAKYYFSTTQPYDSEKLKATSNFTWKYLRKEVVGTFGIDFIKQNIRVYWLVPVTFIAGIYSLLKDRKYWLIIMTTGACVCYYIVMCLTFSNTHYMHRFHIESEWMGLGIIAAAPFVFNLLPKLQAKHVALIVAAICIVRLGFIASSPSYFVKHAKFTREVLAKMKEKNITKLALYDSKLVRSKLEQPWALPEESAILSASDKDNPTRTVIVMYAGLDVSCIKTPNMFLGCFHNYKPHEMNRSYFNIDTTAPYQIMTYTELIK